MDYRVRYISAAYDKVHGAFLPMTYDFECDFAVGRSFEPFSGLLFIDVLSCIVFSVDGNDAVASLKPYAFRGSSLNDLNDSHSIVKDVELHSNA